MNFVPLENIIAGAFFVFPLLLIIVFFNFRNKQHQEIFSRQTMKRGGKIVNYFVICYLEFPHQNFMVKVNYTPGGKNSSPKTVIWTQLPQRTDQLIELSLEDMATTFGKKFGLIDIQLNQPSFDDAFYVKGKDEIFVQNYFNADLQDKLLQMKSSYPSLRISGNSFIFSVVGHRKDEQPLDEFIDLGLALLNRFYSG